MNQKVKTFLLKQTSTDRSYFCCAALVTAASGWLFAVPVVAQSAFEQPGDISTQTIVPGLVMEGDLYKVRPQAYADGLTATFWIDAADGSTYQATGVPMVAQRIKEIYAIEKLRQMESDKEAGNSLGKNASNTVTDVGKTFSDPGKFFSAIPQGASKFFGSLGENMKGGHSQYEEKAYSKVLGESKARRLLAIQLGVNPYSTNETLQKELGRVSWSQASGSITITLAVAAIPLAGTALNMNRNVQSAVASQDPAQLNITNRKRLESIGLSEDDANLLLQHKWFSPVHRTAITDALVSLGPGHAQKIFLQALTIASSEGDANYFQETADLIAQYNRKVRSVGTLQRTGRTVSFVDNNGAWILPVPFDYCLWTQDVHNRALRILKNRHPQQPVILYTTGSFSDLAAAQCQKEGITVMKTVLDGS